MSNQSSGFALWFVRRMLPFLVVGLVTGTIIGFLVPRHPDALRVLQIIGAVILGLTFLVYSWWAIHRSDPGYMWSVPERLGIGASAVAALILSARLALPTLPGAIWGYLIASGVLTFIVRPVLDEYGSKKHHGRRDASTNADPLRR